MVAVAVAARLGQLDKDEVDRMAAATLALILSRLHHPRAMAAGHSERHPPGLSALQTGALAATTQLGSHRRRLALGTHVLALRHVHRPKLAGARHRTHPARRADVSQRVHRAVAIYTRQTNSQLIN